MIVDQFETMLKLSELQPLVCAISLHTFVAAQPFRLTQIRQALQHVAGHPEIERVWITTPGEIASYFISLPEGAVPQSTRPSTSI
jgi:hypothetical protein